MTTEDDLLTLAEAAELTGRNGSVIYDWKRRGALTAAGRKKGRGGMWTDGFKRGDVLRLHEERGHREAADHEPTAEEVERMVAEQMANLPAWWKDEA